MLWPCEHPDSLSGEADLDSEVVSGGINRLPNDDLWSRLKLAFGAGTNVPVLAIPVKCLTQEAAHVSVPCISNFPSKHSMNEDGKQPLSKEDRAWESGR